MREDLLTYLWKTQKFNRSSLKTTNGDAVVIVKPGQENTHAGLFNTPSENLYFQKQQKAHAYLKHKYQLNSSAQNVKFLDYYQAISPLFVWCNWLGLCIKNTDYTLLFPNKKQKTNDILF